MRVSKKAAGVAVVIIAAVLAVGGCSKKGKVREPAKLVAIQNSSLKPTTQWSVSSGGSDGFYSELRATPEVDALYAADISGHVYAFGVGDGKHLWEVNTKARIAAGPSVSGDMIVAGTLDGEVIALKRSDGSPLWRTQLSSEVLGPPVTNGSFVIARTIDGRVYGLMAETGQRLWTFDRTVPDLVLRGVSTPLISGTSVIVGMDNGRLVSLGLTDGQPHWEQAISVPSGRTALDRLVDIDGDMIEGDDCVYVASFGGEVACLDPANGNVAWRRGVKSYNGLAMGGDKVLVSDESGVVWGLDAKSGAAAWKQEGLLYRKLSPPAYFKGYVVVGDFKGYLHWLDPADGKIVGRTRVGSDPIAAQPVATDKLLYVLSTGGKLAAISVADKK